MVLPDVHIVPPHGQYDVNDSYGPPYLIGNSYHMVRPYVCMVSPHVKCLHVLYDSYGPPILYME